MNPTNVGAIFRSAAALGMDAVLLTPGCSNPLYRRSARVSMGTVFQIPWTYIGDEMACWPHPGMEQLRDMGKFNDELVKAGVMLAGEGLQDSSKGARIAYSGNARTVRDGPFTETKELVAGFWIWQVKNRAEAVEWAKRIPFQEGEVEIRQIFEAEDFGQGTLLVRQIPADMGQQQAELVLQELAGDLLQGKGADPSSLRDALLHTIACKASIKAGWHTDPLELEHLVKQVMEREDIKYCPHGRPVCITLTKQQLERQFKRA
jgi:hypothetical protein